MSRRPRTDSLAYKADLRERLKTGIESPIPLSAEEKIVFDGIIAEMPIGDWEAYRIRMAANLSKMVIAAEQCMLELAEEGMVVTDFKAGKVVNPRQKVWKDLCSTISNLSRLLGVSASQRGLSAKETRNRKEAEKETKALLSGMGKNDLLA